MPFLADFIWYNLERIFRWRCPSNSNQLTFEIFFPGNSFSNPLRLSFCIQIFFTDDNAAMIGVKAVQSSKIIPISR